MWLVKKLNYIVCIYAYIQYTTTMGEAQSLQQLMKSSQNIQYHVSRNTNLGQYYLLGVYPVELTTPLSSDAFTMRKKYIETKRKNPNIWNIIIVLSKKKC